MIVEVNILASDKSAVINKLRDLGFRDIQVVGGGYIYARYRGEEQPAIDEITGVIDLSMAITEELEEES